MRVPLIVLLILITFNISYGQGSKNYGKGLKISLDTTGHKFIRVILWNQFWAGLTENNPGTLVNGEPSESTVFMGARRMRVLTHTQISPRYLIVLHAGINNQSFSSGGGSGSNGSGGYGSGKKPQLFFHDAYNEYAIIPLANPETKKNNAFHLYAGAGLHLWNGLSRLTSGSTINTLMIDAPVFNWPTVDMSDQFGRQFGIYAKGGYKKLHYQFHVNKPFATNMIPVEFANIAVDNNGDAKPSYGGYADYQFLEEETQVLPFRVGSYAGTKKVFNIGAGFYHHGNGTKSSNHSGISNSHDISLFGLDVFTDLPCGTFRNMAVTFYGVYYHFNFGPNYLRTSGIMNPGVTDPQFPAQDKMLEGAGNSRVLLGTGKILYGQMGLLLPKFKNSGIRIQPIGAIAYKNLEALHLPGTYWDLGTNLLFDGHHAKLTFQYSSRPLYHQDDRTTKITKGEYLVQFQVYL